MEVQIGREEGARARRQLPHQLGCMGVPTSVGIVEGVSAVILVKADLRDRQAVECGRGAGGQICSG